MSAEFIPQPWQPQMIQFPLEHERCALYMPMGSGKTVSVLTMLDLLYGIGGETRPTLIVAPKRVARKTWPDEVKKWRHLRHLECSPIIGTEAQRIAAMKRNVSLYTINYENVPWLLETLGGRWPFGTVIPDESTRLKGYRTQQGTKNAHALIEAGFRSEHFIELTGTPAPNGLKDLWGQIYGLDGGQRLGKSFNAFLDRWFLHLHGEAGYTKIVPLPHADTEIRERISDICLSIDLAQYLDIAEPFIVKVPVYLPLAARKHYRNMERNFLIELESGTIEAANAGVKSQKLLQIANGAVYLNPGEKEWAPLHEAKLDALDSVIVEAAGMPVLVVYFFQSDLVRLKQRYPLGRELRTERDEDDWNAGLIPVLFIQPGSAGHGLNLQHGGNILAVFGFTWNLEHWQQVIERIGPLRQMQSGYNRPVFIYLLAVEDTVDEDVVARLATKRSVQDCLLEGLRRRAQN